MPCLGGLLVLMLVSLFLYDGIDVHLVLCDFDHPILDVPLDLVDDFVGDLPDGFLVVGGGFGHWKKVDYRRKKCKSNIKERRGHLKMGWFLLGGFMICILEQRKGLVMTCLLTTMELLENMTWSLNQILSLREVFLLLQWKTSFLVKVDLSFQFILSMEPALVLNSYFLFLFSSWISSQLVLMDFQSSLGMQSYRNQLLFTPIPRVLSFMQSLYSDYLQHSVRFIVFCIASWLLLPLPRAFMVLEKMEFFSSLLPLWIRPFRSIFSSLIFECLFKLSAFSRNPAFCGQWADDSLIQLITKCLF